ncbi:MAG: glycosyltransferase family 25 protein [Candidatus Electrothrix communis]|nr:MAG: glycosyltransferase family 25 protein [Candidatus Electrothrix communis]
MNISSFSLLEHHKKTGETDTLPVALISLEDQDERRNLLKKNKIPSVWVDNYFKASDCRLATQFQLSSFADIKTLEKLVERKILPSEIGCALSHRKASDWLAASKFDLLLVLEDDIIPEQSDFEDQLIKIALSFQAIARKGLAFIVHLGASEGQTTHALTRRVWRVTDQRLLARSNIFMHIDPDKTLWRAHAYLISKGAAIQAQELGPKLSMLADDWGEYRKKGILDAIFYCNPKLFKQDQEIPSTIGNYKLRKQYYDTNNATESFGTRIHHAMMNGCFWKQATSSFFFRFRKLRATLMSKIPVILR